MGGELIYEFVGLRPKLYSIQGYVQRKQAAKGIQKSMANSITHQAFKNTLMQKTTKSVQTMRIDSQKHLVQTIQVTKIALSPFDDKRYILEDGVTTLAYGHYLLCDRQSSL